MTVLSSLFSGISGVVANGSAMGVVGDNIANMNTIGFKSSQALFESALSQSLGTAEVGLGTRLAAVATNFSQGTFASSTRVTDLAINGKGYFIVENDIGSNFYTRAGAFELDSNQNLVTSVGGLTLQGYSLDDSGNVNSALSAINLGSVSSDPVETSQVEFSLNLDASEVVPAAFDGSSISAAAGTSNFSTSHVIYDSLGTARSVTTFFRKSAANTWQYFTLTPGSNLTNYSSTADADGTVVLEAGTISYNTDGSLNTVTPMHPELSGDTASALGLSPASYTALEAGEMAYNPGGVTTAASDASDGAGVINWSGANAMTDIVHDFGQVTGSTSVSTQFSTDSYVSALDQDGRSQGSIVSISVNSDGILTGNFNNGTSRNLFSIPLATFANEDGLNRSGSNLYAASAESGTANLGDPNTGDRGGIRSSTLEQSNVDIATEFVRMITYQRAFQASAQTISASSEMLGDLVNIVR